MTTTMTQPNQFLDQQSLQASYDADASEVDNTVIPVSLNAYDDHASTIERAGLRQTDLAARIDSQMKKKHKTKAQLVLNTNASMYNISTGSASSNSLGKQPGGTATNVQSPMVAGGPLGLVGSRSSVYSVGPMAPMAPGAPGAYANYSRPNMPFSNQSRNGSNGSINSNNGNIHHSHNHNHIQQSQQYMHSSMPLYPDQYPPQNDMQQYPHGPPRHFSQSSQMGYRRQQHSMTPRNSSVQQRVRRSPTYGLVSPPGIRQPTSPTSPTRRISLHSFIGLPEDSNMSGIKGQNYSIDSDNDNTVLHNLDKEELEKLRLENETLRKKVEDMKINEGLEVKWKSSQAKLNKIQTEMTEVRQKNESYFYDIAKLKTDSARRQQLNTQLVNFIADMMKKMPGYIEKKESFRALIDSLSIPQSAKQSYKKALESYQERDAVAATGECNGLLTEKDIFEIFREEVKLLNTKVLRLEEEKTRVEQVLQNRIDHERTALRRFTLHRNSSEPILKPTMPSLRSRSTSSFKIIDIVEPELGSRDDGKDML
ncbi:hypothetical protein FOA43_004330 [Brettanomyces nanus]|uniref:Uncharacterized protein n=1 Tax=Eeniella nana TaxID=13502 RepID=A0A875S6H2_EENNA|nr:uncharacterized protein FOA43_004330 [Brettanomyces nanus]QPG76936.1 hypothetical protein FOA43_004330 [Brettanomyces nanus]